jgi:arylsulfatase A
MLTQKKHFVASSLWGLFAVCTAMPVSADDHRLNIVYILADDMGYGDISFYNSQSKIPTPALDSLAASGIVFTDAHSNSSVSTPTRYGTLTGRYAFRSRLKKSVLTGYSSSLIEPERETVASFLQAQGYQTACIGKWHLGLNWVKKDPLKPLYTGSEWDLEDTSNVDYQAKISGGPVDCGFGYSYILPASLDMSPYVYIENGLITSPVTSYAKDYREAGVRGAHYRHGDMADNFRHDECLSHFTQKSVDYILQASQSNQPYFLYCTLTAPHSPWLLQPEFRGRSGAGVYGDFVCMVDDAVRRICDAVYKSGKASQTLIIFTTDNGAMWQPADINETKHYANGGWSGMKSDLWEGGHRVPLIASCPEIIPVGTISDALVSSTDLFATLADMLHVQIPHGVAGDSFSYWSELTKHRSVNKENATRESMIYHSDQGYFALRRGEWVLLDCKGSGGWTLPEDSVIQSPVMQLYNLKKDPAQQHNLVDQYPQIVEDMKKELEEIKLKPW